MIIQADMRPFAHQIPTAVKLSGISRSLIYELIRRGELTVVKIGRRTLIADEDLRNLIARHRVGGRAA
jgi:excisionase family DNA binding protein